VDDKDLTKENQNMFRMGDLEERQGRPKLTVRRTQRPQKEHRRKSLKGNADNKGETKGTQTKIMKGRVHA